MDLTDIFRKFHPKAAEYTFFSSAHGTFSRIDHILGHKSAFNGYKKIEIIPCIFSDHNVMKLEINHKKKFGKITNTWRLKTILQMNEWTNQEVKEEIKKYTEANENDNTTAQNLWDAAKAVITGKYIAIQAFLSRKKGLRYTTQPYTLKSWKKTASKTQNEQKTGNNKD